MLTIADEHDGLREKLAALGYDGSHKGDNEVVSALLAIHLTLRGFDLSPESQSIVLDFLSLSGRIAVNEFPKTTDESWRDFDYGNVKIADFVRVKKDAYDSDTGAKHNGLVGILKSMTSGICTVEYIGLSAGNSMRHPMEKLESLKRGVQ